MKQQFKLTITKAMHNYTGKEVYNFIRHLFKLRAYLVFMINPHCYCQASFRTVTALYPLG